jgi:hypothetical protein
MSYIGNSPNAIQTVDTKYSTTIGDGSATSYTVTHNLNSTDIVVAVMEVSTGYFVYPDIKYTGVNTVVIEFVSAPTTNQYKVNVIAVT